MSDFDEVLFEVRSGIGVIILNRPKALNALTHEMAVAIKDQLGAWAVDAIVKAVAVVGAGEKAFCAGGDVVRVAKSYQDGTNEWRAFFHDEYLMNIAIAEFPKPYISFVDGITMGGGVGVSMPGDFWVASERTLFAMPETGLGLFPDVGGGYFLPRLPGETGMFIALTGARLKVADLYGLGMASHVIDGEVIGAIIADLGETAIGSNDCVQKVLDKYHVDPGNAPIALYLDMIDEHFGEASVESIMASLAQDHGDWAIKQHSIMSTKSPTSMKITFEQLRRGATLSFRDTMQMEFRIVNRCMDGDFPEGVRAILIDKDNSPAWRPQTLEEVSTSDVEQYFAPLSGGLRLNIPERNSK